MKRGHLSDFFDGVSVKLLSSVEVDQAVSNQHEFNGSVALQKLFGAGDRREIPTRFIWIGQEQEASESEEGFLSWYDARRAHPTRTEYRLYYPSNSVTAMMREKDALILATLRDQSVMLIITPSESTMFSQLAWLFDFNRDPQTSFDYKPVSGSSTAELDFAAKTILDELGVDSSDQESALISALIEPFGTDMPRPEILSSLARESVGLEIGIEDPDAALLLWMERETQIFRGIERRIVAERIANGFGSPGQEDVDGFVKFSLSVQNRRKARAGLALESHIEAALKANGVRYSRGAITENGNKPDFLFPSSEAYSDSRYPAEFLLMLGAKSTVKERWRQVLSEAERISEKHLLTLEPSISEGQTDEMRAKQLQLVVPSGLHGTYKPHQAQWLMTFDDFLSLAKARESGRRM